MHSVTVVKEETQTGARLGLPQPHPNAIHSPTTAQTRELQHIADLNGFAKLRHNWVAPAVVASLYLP